jgi:predicted histone-like DNA-binding protein
MRDFGKRGEEKDIIRFLNIKTRRIMALFFKKVERSNPRDIKAPKKWYASLKSIGLKKEREIAILAAEGTTLDPKEAQLAYSRFGIVVIRALLDGHTVEIENFGTFRLTINSEGTDKKEELTANNIKEVNIRFIPDKGTKETLQKATFKDLESM